MSFGLAPPLHEWRDFAPGLLNSLLVGVQHTQEQSQQSVYLVAEELVLNHELLLKRARRTRVGCHIGS